MLCVTDIHVEDACDMYSVFFINPEINSSLESCHFFEFIQNSVHWNSYLIYEKRRYVDELNAPQQSDLQ